MGFIFPSNPLFYSVIIFLVLLVLSVNHLETYSETPLRKLGGLISLCPPVISASTLLVHPYSEYISFPCDGLTSKSSLATMNKAGILLIEFTIFFGFILEIST